MMWRYANAAVAWVILGAGSTVAAQGIESTAGFGVELGGGYYLPDVSRGLDDGGVGALGVEYRFGRHLAVNGWFLRTQKLGTDPSSESGAGLGDGSIDNGHIDLTYYFSNSRWQPYISLGAGRSVFDYDNGINDRQNQYNLGLGLKLHMSPGWFLRGDVRGFRGVADRTDGAAILSVGYLFGQQAKQPPVVDSDGDGVPDDRDQCPDTPAGVAVDSVGCALDSDGDGVPDYRDECPDTVPGVEVDSSGCVVPVVLMETLTLKLDIKARLNSADIGPEGRAEVEKLAAVMRKYPTVDVLIEGHTDSSGTAEYNQKLSEERAHSVAQMLERDFGIDASRIRSVGYGESRPEADNATREGRAANRRIMAVLEAEVEVIEE